MGDYKANQIIVIRKLFQKNAPEKENDYIALLTPEEKSFYATALPISWLDIHMNASMTTKAVRILYPGNLDEAYFKFGQALADHDLGGLYRVMLRVVSVHYLLEKTSKIWDLYHREGRMRVVKGDHHAEVYVENYPNFPEANHKVMLGYMYGGIALTGVKNIKVTGKRTDNETIRYDISWE